MHGDDRSLEHLRTTDTGWPDLHRPVVIAAFEGWNDAGDAASTAARHLATTWSADPFAELDAEEFFDFSTTRPLIHLDDEGRRSLTWPSTSLLAVRGAPRDLLVVLGIEPQLKWRTFTRHLVEVACQFDAELVLTLGALLADVPHTRPTPVYGSTEAAHDDRPELLDRLDLSPSSYEGPTGIVGVLSAACLDAGLPTASLWAAVPAYLPAAPSPKAALALVERIATLLDLTVPTADLEIATAAYERQLDELVDEDEDTAHYVARLEEDFDVVEPDATDLVAEVEQFLRDQR